jgi:hypothetical protein
MKRSIIKYKKIGNRVVIVGFENVATIGQLKEEGVFDEYEIGAPFYYLHHCGEISLWKSQCGASQMWIKIGSKFTKEQFGEIISSMKAAGARLSRITKKHRENEIRKVMI